MADPSQPFTLPPGDFEGYIFDHDGTLALSMHVHFDAWVDAFARNGATFPFTRELAQSYAGVGMHETVEILNRRFGCALDPATIVRDQEAYFFAHLHRVVAYAPVVDFARRVARTHPVSVASGGVRETVTRTMEAVGLMELFPVIVTQDDVTRSKPAPDLFLLAAERMGVDPTRCLVFEDSRLGIRAAEAAGMASVFVQPDDPVA